MPWHNFCKADSKKHTCLGKTSAFCRLSRGISNPAIVTGKISQRESFTIRKSKSMRNMLELAFDNLYWHKFIGTIDLPYSVSSTCTTCWRSFRDIACFILTDILAKSLKSYNLSRFGWKFLLQYFFIYFHWQEVLCFRF